MDVETCDIFITYMYILASCKIVKYINLKLHKPFLVVFAFGGGCFNEVFSNAMAAAACCAFLMDGPDAIYSSESPNFKQTVKDFLCAGP